MASGLLYTEWSDEAFLGLKVGTECHKGASLESAWRTRSPGGGNSKCQGPEAGARSGRRRSRDLGWSGRVSAGHRRMLGSPEAPGG